MKLVYKTVGKILSVDEEKGTATYIPAMQAKYGTQEEMVEVINNKLEALGSKFRTEDGLTISMYIGHMTFLQRTFSNSEELLDFIGGR